MTTLDPQATLADLVIARPELAARLDALGLDYCCGGSQTLADAIAKAGIESQTALAELRSTPPDEHHAGQEAWETIAELADHIEATHHVLLRRSLPRLDELAQKVATVHGENHPELSRVAQLVEEIRADIEPHLLDEENVVFPKIRELAVDGEASQAGGRLDEPIGQLRDDHDRLGALLTELRTVTGGYVVPEDGCASYQSLYEGLAELEADTHLHVHKENNILFPAVLEQGKRGERRTRGC